jgi:hypothetical protein
MARLAGLLWVLVFFVEVSVSSGERLDSQVSDPFNSTVEVGGEFKEHRAIEFAKFAGAAYCSNKSLESWSCGSKCSAPVSSVNVCTGKGTQAFIGLWESKCIVSFEGTNGLIAALQDVRFLKTVIGWKWCGDCRVHNGFMDEYLSLRECVESKLTLLKCGKGSAIRTTGHSLGAAVVTIANIALTKAGWEIEESYNFGSPRVGDEKFAAAYDMLFNRRSWRVTHGRDPVPQLPPNTLLKNWHYQHTVPEIYYKGSVADGYEKCLDPYDPHACIEQYWNVAVDALSLPDHLSYMDVQTSPLGCSDQSP